MQIRVKNPTTPSGKALTTHAKSIDLVSRALEKRGWYPLPFVKLNRKWKYAPKKGAVDLVAIRVMPTKIKRRMDKLQIVLFSLKSGSAEHETRSERKRLQQATRILEIGYDYADCRKGKVEFSWEPREFLEKVRLGNSA